jgi:hypothetical protein
MRDSLFCFREPRTSHLRSVSHYIALAIREGVAFRSRYQTSSDGQNTTTIASSVLTFMFSRFRVASLLTSCRVIGSNWQLPTSLLLSFLNTNFVGVYGSSFLQHCMWSKQRLVYYTRPCQRREDDVTS